MSLDIAILAFTCITNLSLGLLILLRNPKLLSSISFFALSISVSLWGVSNYLTESTYISLGADAMFNRVAYLFGFWCLVCIVAFCYSFPSKLLASKKRVMAFALFVLVVSAVSVTSLVAGNVTKAAGKLTFTVGPLSDVYGLVLVALLVISARRLLKTKKSSAAQVKNQITFLLYGFVASVCLGILMNLVLPAIFDNFQTAKFGPLLTVFVVATTTYAIVRHHLFDIRLVVARSVAYIALISTLAIVFFSIVYALTNFLLSNGGTTATELSALLAALVLVSTSSFFRTYINKVTNSLFYRDSYDPQTFLDQLNSTIINNTDLEMLLRSTASVIEQNLKSDHVVFCIFNARGQSKAYAGADQTLSARKIDPEAVKDSLSGIPEKIIAADDLSDEARHLQTVLRKNNVSVAVNLVPRADTQLGKSFLVLGQKRNGTPYTKQDLRILGIIADGLIIAIQNAVRFEEIRDFNITLQHRINDATRKLRHANEKLQNLDEAKDDFISMASHQLRTPLTSVKGYLSMVLDGDTGEINPTQQQMLKQAFFSSQRMVYLIADLLNVSRLRTGKFVIEAVPTNLAEVIKEEIAQLQDTAESRNLTLDYEAPNDFPPLMLDETKIRQVIMNFIDNAIYYTPDGGHIHVSLINKDQTVEFHVKDNGIGVPKHEQQHLFTKFYRAGNARQARPDGTGLGLFMAKKVVIAQGGTLIFDSQEGKGSTFGFIFNKHKLAPKPATDKKNL